MALDPIVSLAVAIAEAPGSCALFLGSGVSVDAGVPTGWDIYIDGLHRLRRLETGQDDDLDADSLEKWLESTGRKDLGYSGLLDLITPDAAIRRAYLAGYFEQLAPAKTHQRIADLVARGLVKVIVTTNFDRLLEQALTARGVEPVVVSDDATLAAAPRREHVACFMLKAHGDYLQETIRNTPDELASLDPGVTAELQTILDHYGLLVLGYAGRDEAIANALRERSSRYGLWWMSISDPVEEPARTLIEVTGGRTIVRPGAADLLGDIDGRLALYAAHPTGHTPDSVNLEITQLLRSRDEIGLDEALRREHNAYLKACAEWRERHRLGLREIDSIASAGAELAEIYARRLAAIIPLGLHDHRRFERDIRKLGEDARIGLAAGGGTAAALEPERYGAYWIVYAVGALVTRLGLWQQAAAASAVRSSDGYRTGSVLGDAGETGRQVALAAMTVRGHERLVSPWWEQVSVDLSAQGWLRARYPELLDGHLPVRQYVGAFDFVAHLVRCARDERVLAHWTMAADGASEIARRMHADPSATLALASATLLSVEDFRLAVAPPVMSELSRFARDDFGEWQNTVNLFLTGERGA